MTNIAADNYADALAYLQEAQIIASVVNIKTNSTYTAYEAYCAYDCTYSIAGMVDRLVAKHGAYLRYNTDHKEWVIYYTKGKDPLPTWHRVVNLNTIIAKAVDALRSEMQLLSAARIADIFPNMDEEQGKNLFRFYFATNTEEGIKQIELALRHALPMSPQDKQRKEGKAPYLKEAKATAMMRGSQ